MIRPLRLDAAAHDDRAARSVAHALGILPLLTLLALAQPAPRQVLVEFGRTSDISKVQARDVTLKLQPSGTQTGLQLRTGTQEAWPGCTFVAPEGRWNLARYASVELSARNPGTNRVVLHLRVDNPGADGVKNCLTGSAALEPGGAGTIHVPLNRTRDDTLDGKLFGLRGYPVAQGGTGTLDCTNITQLLVFLNHPKEPCVVEVASIIATGEYVPPTASTSDADPFFPLIDTFGQYRHRDWPGKVRSAEDMKQRRETEERDLKTRPGPQDWDQYGGWKSGPNLRASGFFRTEKLKGKWWLVDPDGYLFFSQGVDCVFMQDVTPVEGREDWYADFPGNDPAFQEFVAPRAYALKGHYAGKSPRSFSFAFANLKRKYGPDWRAVYPAVIQKRLRSWGVNTIAMWSDLSVGLMRRTPYVDALGSDHARRVEGSEGYWGKFPDVFDPAFKADLEQQMARKAGKSAGDPWCLGYFSDNEMSWGDDLSLALATLTSPADQPAKLALVKDLQSRYGEISKLNEAWGTSHTSWDALLQQREAPDRQRAAADLAAFYTRTAETYFRTVREAIKGAAPQQLYLGCRFAWVNARAAAAAAKFCDVVSYNLYQRSVADFVFNGGADVPLIIGEFHFGALDRGMFHTGLVPVASQAARARAYQDYVKGALRHPQFVGCHWFQYQDEPTTGRVYDEENYQIGFVDTADTPYAETVNAVREIGYEMYRLRYAN